MGSSDSGGAGLADSGAGSIVWVRRRNGSWWPGKILGTNELSSSHLMSPRSGTPVKLLGKEDASVDWYNLEKSKRVKAFRCGEFDDCIERAEASLGLPARKREKYARREDAILHALELEKQILEKYGKVGTSNSVRENSSDSERKHLSTSLGALENGNGKLGHHGLYQLGKKVDISNIMERYIPLHAQKSRDANHPSLPEHNSEASHQMRELVELGLRTVPVNRMIYTSAASDDSNRMTIDGHAHVVSAIDPCFENSSDSDSRNSIGKGKRLLEGLVYESLPKRHDRHHIEMPDGSLQPDGNFNSKYGKDNTGDGVCHSMNLLSLSPDMLDTNHGPKGQMEISVSQLEMGNSHLQHGTSAEESTSGSSEQTESDSLETHSFEQHVDAGVMLSDAETLIRAQSGTLDRLEMQGGHESTSGDEYDKLSLGDRPQFYHHGRNPTCFGVSKWQLKGKRNIRNSTKRHADGVTHRTYVERRGRSLNQRGPSHHSLSYYHDNDCGNDVDFIENDSNSPTQGFSKRGYLPSQAAAKSQNIVGRNMIDWEELTRGRPFRGFWDDNPTFVVRNGHDMLIDVDLKVQANRQGEHVPWVSLMSRLNGKAIIGHPIQIEPLEDGSTDVLVSTSGVCGNLKHVIDRNRVPPVWSTARRTANFRVPRHHQSSQLDGDDEDADDRYFHQSKKIQSKKPSLMKNTHSPVSRSQLQGMKKKKKKKKKKKPPRKVNPSPNQKTKALSSISYDQKLSNKRRDDDINTSYYMGGVIMPVDSGTPAVACIPVKLVFSRLLEAVGRPPSGSEIRRRNPS